MAVAEGMKAPLFTLQDQEGREISLESLRGRKIALYFYPKDNTPGCTRQACAFALNYAKLKALKVEIVGISKDSQSSHEKFAQKYELPFMLLSDSDHKVMEDYGVWAEKKMYGKVSMGVVRSCFLLDEEGTVIKIWKRVKPDDNAKLVLDFLSGHEKN